MTTAPAPSDRQGTALHRASILISDFTLEEEEKWLIPTMYFLCQDAMDRLKFRTLFELFRNLLHMGALVDDRSGKIVPRYELLQLPAFASGYIAEGLAITQFIADMQKYSKAEFEDIYRGRGGILQEEYVYGFLMPLKTNHRTFVSLLHKLRAFMNRLPRRLRPLFFRWMWRNICLSLEKGAFEEEKISRIEFEAPEKAALKVFDRSPQGASGSRITASSVIVHVRMEDRHVCVDLRSRYGKARFRRRLDSIRLHAYENVMTGRAALNVQIGAMIDQILAQSDDWTSPAADLGQLLFADPLSQLQDWFGGSLPEDLHMRIIPSGSFGDIPYAALLVNGAPLVHHAALSLHPGGVGLTERKLHPEALRIHSIVNRPQLLQDWSWLAEHGTLKERFTEERLRMAFASERALNLVTHVLASHRSATEDEWMMADGSLLRLETLLPQDLSHLDFLMLCCCQTSRQRHWIGRRQRVSESLPNSLWHRRGVGAVLGSSWRIKEHAAGILSLRFYQALTQSGNAALALREAQLHMAQLHIQAPTRNIDLFGGATPRKPETFSKNSEFYSYQHPYFWAGQYLSGGSLI